jgi:hypothetical protein
MACESTKPKATRGIYLLLGLWITTQLSACSQMNAFRDPEWSFWGYGRITEAGAVGNIPPKFERVNLMALIEKLTPVGGPPRDPPPVCTNLQNWTFEYFSSYVTDTPEDQCAREQLYEAYNKFQASGATALHRNAIQDEILRASDQRFGVYKIHLRRLQSTTSFLLGASATALGGLGAIFTAADTARALAGAAGITSGVNAEYQESFFASVLAPVIIDGMEARRSALRQSIEAHRKEEVLEYPLQAALADAARYAVACSASEGLAEARKTVQIREFLREGTGMDTLVAFQEQRNGLLRKQIDTANLLNELQRAEAGHAVKVNPSSLNFARVQIHTTSGAQRVTLTNYTDVDVTIDSVTNEKEVFSTATTDPRGNNGDTCTGQKVPPTHSCNVWVQFTPAKRALALSER